LGKKEAMRLV
jgi:hypothetical protein